MMVFRRSLSDFYKDWKLMDCLNHDGILDRVIHP